MIVTKRRGNVCAEEIQPPGVGEIAMPSSLASAVRSGQARPCGTGLPRKATLTTPWQRRVWRSRRGGWAALNIAVEKPTSRS
jgi:hypothetical protein